VAATHDGVPGPDLTEWQNVVVQYQPTDVGCLELPLEFTSRDAAYAMFHIADTKFMGAMASLQEGRRPCAPPPTPPN
jgi:hypothetical protein